VSDAAGQPLLLTPLIDAGLLDEAKSQSLVQPALGDIESYAGFLTVNRSTKSHLYFWYVPRTTAEPAEGKRSPLILWLQGGPGCSSLFGLFEENGPFKVTEDGRELRKREYAWTSEYHLLYVDQPVGTGFSYTEDEKNGYISSQVEVGEHLYEALLQFYKTFPELKEHDFYIAGESYAGKYVPALAYKIHNANRHNQSNHVAIPFKGMMIGNGVSDALNMLPYSVYLYNLGLIDGKQRRKLEVMEEDVEYLVQSEDWLRAYDSFSDLESAIEVLRYVSIYDYTRNVEHIDDPYVDFLARDSTRKSIHVGGVKKYELCSRRVFQLFTLDFMQSVRPWVENLLEHYPTLYYNGQFDLACSHPNKIKFLRGLRWSGAGEYGLAERKWWLVEGKAAGFYKTGSNLVDLLVRDAGHMVPSDQPKVAFEIVRAFIEKRFHNATLL
jgi:vitellogenic carboxypeptidase-like protein